jgi:hypothetical protein
VVILELIHAQGPERGGQGFTALFSHAQRDVFIRLKTSGRGQQWPLPNTPGDS